VLGIGWLHPGTDQRVRRVGPVIGGRERRGWGRRAPRVVEQLLA
jgi:hypothetical protein